MSLVADNVESFLDRYYKPDPGRPRYYRNSVASNITQIGFKFRIAGSKVETIGFINNTILVYSHSNEKIYLLRYGGKAQ